MITAILVAGRTSPIGMVGTDPPNSAASFTPSTANAFETYKKEIGELSEYRSDTQNDLLSQSEAMEQTILIRYKRWSNAEDCNKIIFLFLFSSHF